MARTPLYVIASQVLLGKNAKIQFRDPRTRESVLGPGAFHQNQRKISHQVPTSGLGGSWIPDSACSTNPCLNGGKCLIAWGGYECVCLSGYFGDTCEHDPCKIVVQNGGTETIEDFHCGGNKFFRGTQR